MDSILISIKKMLGIEADYAHFDMDIIITINSIIMSLNQLGIGPESGFVIRDESQTWSDLLGDRNDLESVKSFIYLKTRLIFDPPTSSFVLESMNKSIQELEWRLNIQAEKIIPVEGGVV